MNAQPDEQAPTQNPTSHQGRPSAQPFGEGNRGLGTDLNIYEEERPWGHFEQFVLNKPCTVKYIQVEPEQKLSYQYHQFRDEFWKVVGGTGYAILDGKVYAARTGDEFFVPRGTKHRIMANPEGLQFLEISFGTFDEQDNIRLDDEYGRTKG